MGEFKRLTRGIFFAGVGILRSVDSRTIALYNNVILPFRTLSSVRYFAIPSEVASRFFPAGVVVPFALAFELCDSAAPFVPVTFVAGPTFVSAVELVAFVIPVFWAAAFCLA